MLAAALLSCARLTQHVFWDDEAYTAIMARNWLRSGTLTGWDGHNLLAYNLGWALDAQLQERVLPPLQFLVAAASMAVLGQSTLAGRLPFVILGLLSLPAVYLWCRRISCGSTLPAALPVWLLALNVPFLLYIAQCRYYSLILLFTPVILLCFAAAEAPRRRVWFGAGAAAMLLLMLSHYIAGVAVGAALGAVAVMPHRARRRRIAFVVALGAVALAVLSWAALRHGLLHLAARPEMDAAGRWHNFCRLLLLELRDIGPFEYFPMLPLPLLTLPWLVARLAPLRGLARQALAVVLMMAVTLVVAAATSPKQADARSATDLRYALTMLPMGVFPTAVSVWILRVLAGRAAGAAAISLILFTNIAYHVSWAQMDYPAGWPVRCTLCDRIGEMARNHPSGSDALLDATAAIPPGTMTLVEPRYFGITLLFYRPDLNFIDVLARDHAIDPVLRAQLPSWIWADSTVPDAVVHGMEHPMPASFAVGGQHYQAAAIVPYYHLDRTRPELPWHYFSIDPVLDQRQGWVVYARTGTP